MNILKFFPILLAGIPSLAPAQNCACADQFEWLRQNVVRNYSGFSTKVTAATQAEFDRHTAAYQAQASGPEADTSCARLLAEWLDWFHDGHLSVSGGNPGGAVDTVGVRQRFATWETIALSEADARLFFQQPMRDPMEGIYEPAEGNYRVALVRNPAQGRDFAAIILQADSVWWMPGHIKFELKLTGQGRFTSRYYMRDHSERNPAGSFSGGVLQFDGLGAWRRIFPGEPAMFPPTRTFSLQQLDSATLLLRLPTMHNAARLELDSLLQANRQLLENTPKLIIDCRGNGGGSDITFFSLRRYVYSGPVTGYPAQLYATEDNAKSYDELAGNKNFPKLHRANFKRIARNMRRHPGKFLGKCKPHTQKIKNLSPNPRRIAILIDGGCASSCEQFVYYARQSNRVSLLGQNTAGIFDFGNVYQVEFPCGGLRLNYPTSRTCRIDLGEGLDGVGIPPNIRLDATAGDWVEWAKAHMRE